VQGAGRGTLGKPTTVLSITSSSLSTHTGAPPPTGTGPKGGIAPDGGPRGKKSGDGCGVNRGDVSGRRGRMPGDASIVPAMGPSSGEVVGRPIHCTMGADAASWKREGAGVGAAVGATTG